MHKSFFPTLGMAATLSLSLAGAAAADNSAPDGLKHVVTEAIEKVMTENGVPGVAVAVTVRGTRHYFNYGVASKESGPEIDEDTIFEIGSVSKTFTATLGAYAEVQGALSLSDDAGKYLPELAGSSLGGTSLLDLATYTAGGLPLQFPDDVTDEEKMIAYYKAWKPAYPAGTHRVYSNPSIGLFGHLAARSMGKPFGELMEGELFPALGLPNTYIRVPAERMADYAFGYSKGGKPVRVRPGVLDAEAYGVKTTATDMIRFVEANIDSSKLDETFRRAIAATHTGHYRVGGMTQGLGWETYPYPVSLERLLAGNSPDMAMKPNEAVKLDPPLPPQDDVLINKTGSTKGFGTYVAFVPGRQIGVVILANRNYPIPERIKAAHRILSALDGMETP